MHTEATKEKIRLKRIAFFANGGVHPRGMLGKKAWNNLGKEWKCCDCGKKIWYGKTRCKRCARKGKLNPSWKNGISKSQYPYGWKDKLKDTIRQRDFRFCEMCGVHQAQLKGRFKKLSIHHIDYNKNNLNKNNLITLCASCHSKTNYHREYWKNYFQKKMQDKNVDITKMDLTNLQALGYQLIAAKENAERNLQMVNQEIAKRLQSAQPLTPVQPEVETPKIEEAVIKEETK